MPRSANRWLVEPARPNERAAAFRLVFRSLPDEERNLRILNAMQLVETGQLDPAGVLVARRREELLGALVCMTIPGGSGLVWPPQAVDGPDRTKIEDSLLQHASAWLRKQGCKLGQGLLSHAELDMAPSLERNGYDHITGLWYMRHDLDLPTAVLLAPERFTYRAYEGDAVPLFHETLLRTYEGTQDCPEVTGVRTLEEIIEGHRSQGRHDPKLWWLALDGNQPAGVVLLTEMPEWESWDISYFGVVPEARRRGVGRDMLRLLIWYERVVG
jgi:ribosomal protein S18 acetylase RimI-like enzyme